MSLGFDPAAADAEPDVELAQQLLERCKDQPLVEGSDSDTWRYLVEARGLAPEAVRFCAGDLRVLAAPVPGLDRLASGIVSLLRDREGEITGLAVEGVGLGGARLRDGDGRTVRRTYVLRARGQVDALFRVAPTAPGGMVGYLAEGRLAKVIALSELVPGAPVYGFGGLAGLGCCPPPEPTVIVIEDRPPEDPAQAEAHRLATERGLDRLVLAGRAVLRAGPPPCGCCKDVDAAFGKHPLEELRAWPRSATPYELSLDGHARRIADIKDPLRRGQAAAEVAGQHQLRKRGLTKAFREQVAKYAGQADDSEDGQELQGDDPQPADVRPWPHEVDGLALVAAITNYLKAHVILPEHAALTCALWVLHTHALGAAYHSPRLVLRSATKGCGKSSCRRALARLVPRPFEAVDITGPTLFRPIGQWAPTVLVDEGNEIDWTAARDLVAVVNSGHCRDDPGVPRCVGPDFEVRMFRVWAPLCLALIGRLPTTIAERSIIITMRKKLREVSVQRMVRRDRDTRADELARKAARWAVDHVVALEAAEPELPTALGDRPADNWRPLLAIADLIGLGAEARNAATALSLSLDDDEDLGIQLLVDVHTIFDAAKEDQLSSAAIIGQLIAMEGRPWPELGRMQQPITANRMARLLKPFGIAPSGTLWIGGRTAKGYRRSAFDDAWKQYSINVPPQQPSGRQDQGNLRGSEDSQPSGPENNLTDGNGLEPKESAAPDGLTDENGVGTEEHTESPIRGNGAYPGFLTCEACNGLFAKPKRGRPPKRCPECRGGRITGADTTPTVEGL